MSVTLKKKCIVLDLDNTLWGGVIGEDGMQGISLDLTPTGSGFLSFQQALLDHYHQGIILAINSRNNWNDAFEVIQKHPNMLLKEHHFAAFRINWNDKAENLKELAEELNIGLDSMVFLDDDPMNRSLVRGLLPEVETPDLPMESREYTKFLHSLPYFTSDVITDEDKMRGNLYVTERLRKEEEKLFENKADFLKNLALELTLYQNDMSCLPRLSQLTEKTNQFNIKKHPYSEEEIRNFAESKEYDLYYGRLQDVFGDYGVILFALVRKDEKEWHIETLLMSCRVFDKGVEQAFLEQLLLNARNAGVGSIGISFDRSEKNAPAEAFVLHYFGERKKREVDEFPIVSHQIKTLCVF